MSERSTLGVVIRRRRRELGWTQEELAERISVGGEHIRQSEISRIENGKIELPRHERLARLADVLDLSLGELLSRSGWVGADRHFDERTVGGASTPPKPSVAPSAALDPDRNDSKPQREAVNGHSCLPSNGRDTQSVAAFRKALSTMRDESERLMRNRAWAIEIMDQFHIPAGRNGESAGEDQPNPTST